MRAPVFPARQREGEERAWPVFLLLLALVFLRCCCEGLRYYPQLDDYIQHYDFANLYDGVWQVVTEKGLLASRPLAGLLDVAFWSRFWPVMILGVLLISALYAASAVLFWRVLGGYFPVSPLFLVLYALFPLNMEGTYWMSASTRVVPALAFTALAMWLFQRWCREGGWRFLALYVLAQLLSYGFYEQGLALCATGVVLVALLEWRDHPRRAWAALASLVNIGLYFGFISLFSGSASYGGRMNTILPWQEGWKETVFLPLKSQLRQAFGEGGVQVLGNGLRRGWTLVVSQGHWLWLILTAGLCLLLFVWLRQPAAREERPRYGALPALAVGALLALAPVSVFFILRSPWFSLRGTVTSFCGLALMADTLWTLVTGPLKCRRAVTAGVCAALALLFCVAAASEVHDYGETWQADQAVISAVVEATDGGADLPREGTTAFVGVEPSYLAEQNFNYHEHIHGVTESGWAMNGALQWASGRQPFPVVVPLPASTPAAALAAGEYAAVYGYDPSARQMVPLTLRVLESGDVRLYTDDGTLWGQVTEAGLTRGAGEGGSPHE